MTTWGDVSTDPKHEEPIQQLIDRLLTVNDCFWDVGAHSGVMSSAARRGRPDVTIVALEPLPIAFEMLLKTFHDDPLFTAVLGAGWSSREILMLVPGTHAMLTRVARGFKVGGLVIPGLPLDDLLYAGAAGPNVMKLDCEGAELEVLRGANAVLSLPGLRALIVEWEPALLRRLGSTTLDLEVLLRTHGFKSDEMTYANSRLWTR